MTRSNPGGEVQMIDTFTAPFAPPDLKSLLPGLKLVMGKECPLRGRA